MGSVQQIRLALLWKILDGINYSSIFPSSTCEVPILLDRIPGCFRKMLQLT